MENSVKSIPFCLLILCLLSHNLASAEIYQWTDIDDTVHFSDNPMNISNVKPPVNRRDEFKKTASQTSNSLPAEDRLKSCDQSVAIAAAEEIVGDPTNLIEPMQLFNAAFAFFQNGKKNEGVFWFYAAQLRVRQQLVVVVENGDRSQILSIMLMTMGPIINNYAFQNTSNLNQILNRVLEWDKNTTNPFRDKARLQKLEKQVDQVYVVFGELRAKLVTEKNTMETTAREAAPGIEQIYAQMNSQRCRKGQPDPAYENQTKKEEEQLALDYITHNEQVIKLAGGAVKTYPVSSTTYTNDRNKGRYEFSIIGTKFYAIVDVNRSSRKSVFTLACVTTLSMGYREAGKDDCSQSTIQLPK